MNFGNNLSTLRRRKKISQEELAYRVGVSRQTIYTWEADIASPNVGALKSLAEALDVSVDELVSGSKIEALPRHLKPYTLQYLGESEPVLATGILDWFIDLRPGNEMCFGLYDDGVKDYSYHLSVLGEVLVHAKRGYEVLVEEYDPKLVKQNTYSLVASHKGDKMEFVAKIDYEDGVKRISTYKDKAFVRDWGGEADTYFEHTKRYLLTYGDTRYQVTQICYHSAPDVWVECYLDDKGEALLWRRFDKGRDSKERRTVEGESYGYFYEVITDRLR